MDGSVRQTKPTERPREPEDGRAAEPRGFARLLRGSSLSARAARSSAFAAAGFGAGQAIRLGSNLVLTRILFPEDFGLMALVLAVTTGLALLSDVGLGPAIMQSRAGDEPRFLDTAWTIQVLRGAILFLATCALALPLASLYGEPLLAAILPVAGLSLLVSGFLPTKIETAHRHLRFGRVIVLDLLSQVVATIVVVALALWLRSVFALAIGLVVGAAIRLALISTFLPGRCNRLGWDRLRARELVRFGIWIFASTACAFVVQHADKLLLAKLVPLDVLGFYAIAQILASSPIALQGAILGRTMIPLYRERPPSASARNRIVLRRARIGAAGGTIALLALVALVGVPLVELLYREPFTRAGPLVVLVACASMPAAALAGIDQAALAAGDSRGFFAVVATRALAHLAAFVAGYAFFGLPGAIAGQAVAVLCAYPVLLRLLRRHGAAEPVLDAALLAASALLALLAIAVSFDAIAGMAWE